MSKSDQVYLIHILRSIDNILKYTQNISEEEFYLNQQLLDAVVRNFEIIGEASKKISNETKEKHPQIEWKKMAGMRDKLIHNYIEVDYIIVWTTVKDILPELLVDINRINESFTS
jgi:uncharacterized protein with HEPN domain